MRISLRTSLAASFAVIILLLSVGGSLVAGRESSERFQREIGNSLSGVAYQMSDKLDNFMWSRSGELDVLSGLDEFRHPDAPDRIKDLLQRLKASFPSFTWIGYIDPKGTVLAATDGLLEGADLAERPVYQEGLKGKYIGDVHDAKLLAKLLPNPTGEPLQFVDISVPVHSEDGELQGILAAHLSWEWAKEVSETILDSVKGYKSDLDILVVSQTDRLVLLGPESLARKPLPEEAEGAFSAARQGGGWQVQNWPDGKFLTGYAYGDGYMGYPGLGWTVLVREPAASAFAPASDVRRSILELGALAALVFGVLCWFVAKRLARPILAIVEAADRLADGEEAEIPRHRGLQDLELLSDSLRRMVDHLSRTENALDRMETLALRDALTGLSNRIGLDGYLDEQLPRALERGDELAFLCLDLDGFKKINDTYGHPAGDQLLKQVASRLSELLPPAGVAVRLGGDEFLVSFPVAPGHAEMEIRKLGSRIIQALNAPIPIEGASVRVGCSIGAALCPRHHDDPLEAMRMGDEALYESKRGGKNRLSVYGGSDGAPGRSETG